MRVGSVGYATRQGLGYLMKSFYDAGVINEVMIYRHPSGTSPSNMDWYPQGTPELTSRRFIGTEVGEFMSKIDVLLCFETPFDWEFAETCQRRGIKTVIMPMYEWFPQSPSHQFDLFLNPSLLDQEYFPKGKFIPVPVDDPQWSLRRTAKRYLHNAGNIGCRGHKGTLELLKAMPFVKSPIELTVRAQYGRGLQSLIDQTGADKDSRITFVTNEIPREDLFKDYDVYVAPEKFNGLSLPLQEAFAAGLMVMTTNRFPANTWLPIDPLIHYGMTQKSQVARGYLEFYECIVDPRKIAHTIDFWYDCDIETYSLDGQQYGRNNSWEALKPRYMKALEELCL